MFMSLSSLEDLGGRRPHTVETEVEGKQGRLCPSRPSRILEGGGHIVWVMGKQGRLWGTVLENGRQKTWTLKHNHLPICTLMAALLDTCCLFHSSCQQVIVAISYEFCFYVEQKSSYDRFSSGGLGGTSFCQQCWQKRERSPLYFNNSLWFL